MDECAPQFYRFTPIILDDFMKVTVFMPVYNGEKYLDEAIQSVLNQTYPNFHFLIINDGSTDRSKQIISSYRDERIQLIHNQTPSGLKNVRNQGLQEAKGEYFAPIDCDDVWSPKKLEKQVEFLESHPEFSFIGSRAQFIDENGNIQGTLWRYTFSPKKIAPFLLFSNYFIHSSILIRRSKIPPEGYQATTAEDYDLWVRMSRLGPIWSLPHILVKYRVHTEGDTYRQAILSDRTQQQVRKIYLSQLQQLGIDPTPEELDLHTAICKRTCTDLKKEAIWLSKLLEANRKSLLYDPNSLIQIILERWLMNCYSAKNFKAYFSLNISKLKLFLAPLQFFVPFLRYLNNRDLGKL